MSLPIVGKIREFFIPNVVVHLQHIERASGPAGGGTILNTEFLF